LVFNKPYLDTDIIKYLPIELPMNFKLVSVLHLGRTISTSNTSRGINKQAEEIANPQISIS